MVKFKEIIIHHCDFILSKIKKYYLIKITIIHCDFNKIKKYYFSKNRNSLLRFS